MAQTDNAVVSLLHRCECPFDYRCQATDCVECLKIHMDPRGEKDGKKQL